MSNVQQFSKDAPPYLKLRPLSGTIRHALFASAGALLVQGATLEPALAGPQGGSVAAGQGQINTPNATTTVVQQQSHSLVVNWQTFNVAKNELVQFNQPSASASVLNRVLNQTPSQIFGSVNANGKVFLLNPGGVVIGKTARVNVGSLFMSSLDIGDDDFMSGKYQFARKDGSPAGAIVNRGLIQAATGGSVTLVADQVSNEGVIVADAGHVNLAAGRTATVDFNGDGLIHFEVDGEVLENAFGADAAVANSGEIRAEGGQVLLTASTASQVFDRAVNNSGLIRAGSIQKAGGKVTLSGFGGGVVNTGTIDASGTSGGEVRMVSDSVIEQFGTARADGSSGDGGSVHLASADTTLVGGDSLTSARSNAGKGGRVAVLGEKVGLFGNARVDASGVAGGGTALIGGDFQGKNAEVKNARRTYIASDVRINADAGAVGDGGKVIVWADEVTRFFGAVSSRGGSEAGDGGFVEVSGKQGLTFHGEVDTRAANGRAGTLLLDPDFISIIDGAASTGDQDANLLADDDIAFADANTALNTVSVGQINDSTGSVTIHAGQIDFNNTTDITMGAGLAIAFTVDNTADANSAGGDNTIQNIGGNAFSITTNGAGTINFDAGGLVDLTDITLNSASTITVNSGGSATLDVLNTTGNIDVTTGIGAITLAGAVTGATVTLAAGGTIADALGGIVTAGVLDITSDGGVALNTSSHVVEAFTASNATGGSILLSNNTAGGTLDVQAITQAVGGANAVTITETGGISLSGALGGVDNTVTLSAGGTITDSAGGIVTAALLDTTSDGGVTLNTGTHVLEAFSASNTIGGSILLSNNTAGGTLDVQAITQAAGGANAVTITEVDGISLSGALNGMDNTVTLGAGGSIGGAGLITGNTVDLGAAAGISASTEAGILNAVNGSTGGNVIIAEATGVQVNSLSNAAAGGTLSLTSAGDIDLNSSVTTAGGSVSLDSGGNALKLLSSVLIDTTNGEAAPLGGNINFVAGTTIDGDASGTRTLDLSAGDNGTVTVASAVGSINPLLSFTVRGGPGTTALTDRATQADLQAVTTNGGDIIVVANVINATGVLTTSGAGGGALTLDGGAITLGATPVVGVDNITLRGNGGADQDLIITAALSSATSINLSATRDVIVQALIDTSSGASANIIVTADSDLLGNGGVLVDAAGELRAGNDITLIGSALNSALVAAATGDSVAVAASGNVNSGRNATSGGGNISIAAGTNAPATADIFAQGTVSTALTTTGGSITMDSARDIRLGSMAIATEGGVIALQDDVALDAATTITNNGSGGVANVTFAGAVGGAFDLLVNSSGISTFTGAVTTASLTTDANGTTAINSSVTTTGSQTYNDAVAFAAASTLTSSGGGDLVLAAGGLSTAGDLSLITDGAFTLGAALAATGRIVTLDTNSATTAFVGADNAVGLGLSNAEIGQITASLIRVGQLAGPTNNTVNFNAAISAAGKTLAVRTTGAGGAIIGNPGIVLDRFGLQVTTTPQAISLLSASNVIGNVALQTGGADITYGQPSGFTVATVDGIVGVNATTANNINLGSSSGAISQAAGALVIANQVTTTSTGGVGFGVEANQVTSFSAANTGGGTIALNNSVGDLDVSGIAAGGANVTLVVAGDSAANDSLTQSAAITGAAVLNATSTIGNVNLAGANVVTGVTGGAASGNATFNNNSPTLALGPLSATMVSVTNSGAMTSAGAVTSTAALSLTAGGPLVATTVTGSTMALTSAGNIVVNDDGFSTSQLTINPAGARTVVLGGAATLDSAAIAGLDADDSVILTGPASVVANVATGGYNLGFANAAAVALGAGVSSISAGAGNLRFAAGLGTPAGPLTLTAGTTNLSGAIAMTPGASLTIASALNLTSKTQLTTNALTLGGAVTGSDLTILRTTSADTVLGGTDPIFSQANLDQFAAYTGTLSLGGERTVVPASSANLLGNVAVSGLLRTAGDIFVAGAGDINFHNTAAGVGRVESTKTNGVVSIAALGSSSVGESGNITDSGVFNSFANPDRVAVAVGSSGTIELLANNQIGSETGGGAKFNLSAPTLSVAQVAAGDAQVDNAVFRASNTESVQEILTAYLAPGSAISAFIGSGLGGAVLQSLFQTPSSTPKQEKGELGFIDEGVFLLPSTFTNPERAVLMPILGDPDFPSDQRPEDPDADDEWLTFFEDVVREYIVSRYLLAENATSEERAAIEAIVASELQAIIAFYEAVRERERTQLAAAAQLDAEQPESDDGSSAAEQQSEQPPDAPDVSKAPVQQGALPVDNRTLGYIGRSWSAGGIGFEVRG